MPMIVNPRDQEVINERCADLWAEIFIALDGDLGGDEAGRIAQIASDSLRAKLSRSYAVWIRGE